MVSSERSYCLRYASTSVGKKRARRGTGSDALVFQVSAGHGINQNQARGQ